VIYDRLHEWHSLCWKLMSAILENAWLCHTRHIFSTRQVDCYSIGPPLQRPYHQTSPLGGIGSISSLRSNCIAILLLDSYTVNNFFDYNFAKSQRMASEKLLDSSLTDITTLLDTTIFDLNLFVHKLP